MVGERASVVNIAERALSEGWNDFDLEAELGSTPEHEVSFREAITAIGASEIPFATAQQLDRIAVQLMRVRAPSDGDVAHMFLAQAWLDRAQRAERAGYAIALAHCRAARAVRHPADANDAPLLLLEVEAASGSVSWSLDWIIEASEARSPQAKRHVLERALQAEPRILGAEALSTLNDLAHATRDLEALGDPPPIRADVLFRETAELRRWRTTRPLDAAIADYLGAVDWGNRDWRAARRLVAETPTLQDWAAVVRIGEHMANAAARGESIDTQRFADAAAQLARLLHRIGKAPRGGVRAALWVPFLRAYLLDEDDTSLRHAEEAAHVAGDRRVAALLAKLSAEDRITVALVAGVVEARLWLASRYEDALTIALLTHAGWVTLVEDLDESPLEQRAYLLDWVQEAVHLSVQRGDHGLAAHYAIMRARGLLRIRRLGEAGEAYNEVAAMCRRLGDSDPALYAEYLPEALNSLGMVLRQERRYGEAEATYNEMVQVLADLSRKDPDEHRPDYATALRNLGIALSDQEPHSIKAELMLRAAITIWRELVASGQETYLVDVADALRSLGNVLQLQRRYTDAEQMLEEALELHQSTTTMHAAEHLPAKANVLQDLGTLWFRRHRYGDAERVLREAETILRALAADQAAEFLPALVIVLNNLGAVTHGTHRLRDAEALYREIIAILQRDIDWGEHIAIPDLSTILGNLGMVLSGQRRYEEAEGIYRSALHEMQRPDVVYSDHQRRWTAKTLSNLAVLLDEQRRDEEADETSREAVEILYQLLEHDLAQYGPDFVAAIRVRATILNYDDRPDQAERMLRQILDVQRRLMRADPDQHRHDVAMTLHNLGNALVLQERDADAKEAYEEAKDLLQELYNQLPDVYANHLATALTSIAGILERQQCFPVAERMYHDAANLDPAKGGDVRWRALRGLARIARKHGDGDTAHGYLTAGVTDVESIRAGLERQSDRRAWQGEYQSLYQDLVDLSMESGNRASAWQWAERGKGRLLLDLFSSADADSDSVRRKESQWLRQMTDVQRYKLDDALLARHEPRQGANEYGARGEGQWRVTREESRRRHVLDALRIPDADYKSLQVLSLEPGDLIQHLRALAGVETGGTPMSVE